MINRIFFILEFLPLAGELPLPEKNVYYALLVPSPREGALEEAYRITAGGDIPQQLALVVDVSLPLSDKDLELLAAFLFLPGSLYIGNRPVIHLYGDSPSILTATPALTRYLAGQGLEAPLVLPPIPHDTIRRGNYPPEDLAADYTKLLRDKPVSGSDQFFFASSKDSLHSAIAALRQAEAGFSAAQPQLYASMLAVTSLANDLEETRQKYKASLTELHNLQEYNAILRSDHQAREIQAYYDREYEALPLWFKRLGHFIKVLTGKRTFRSLFRDDVKKYKD